MAEIKLYCGAIALVDDEDYVYLSLFKWSKSKRGYAVKNPCTRNSETYMHRLVNKTPAGNVTDHINRDKLDNRKCNLRSCTQSENLRNASKAKNKISKYKGVSADRKSGMWRSYASINKKFIHIGTFKTEIEAALAYNEYTKINGSEFSILNIIE